MTRAKQTVPVPRQALPDGEANRFLARFKTSLAKRWSHTRMNELYETGELAVFLWALEREQEALGIVRSVTSEVTSPLGRDGLPNYNVWSPVAELNAIEARILRAAGDTAAAAVPAGRIAADCGIAANRDFVERIVTEAQDKLDEAAADSSTKWACHKLGRQTARLILLGELSAAGHAYAAWYDAGEVERLIGTGRTRLAARLATA